MTEPQRPIELPTCQVCDQRPSVGVACSPLGPISVSYCLECLHRGAEPMWLIDATVELCGGIEHVHESLRHVPGYVAGDYITWEQWQQTGGGRK